MYHCGRKRKRPRSFLNVAFIYAGNCLLSHTRVGRTLLSAAFELGVILAPFIRQPLKIKGKSKSTSTATDRSVRSTHTLTGLIECPSVTDSCRQLRFESTCVFAGQKVRISSPLAALPEG